MMDEKGIALRYLKSQKKRSILLIFGVILAIALVSTVFSMLNVLQIYEVTNASEDGIWYVSASNCTAAQSNRLERRVDVSASGRIVNAGTAIFKNETSINLKGCDNGGVNQLNIKLQAGKLPQKNNEIALEEWALKKIKVSVGDSITLNLNDKTDKEYVVSGSLKDKGNNKASNFINAVVTLKEAQRISKTDKVTMLMQVKNGLNINKFVDDISSNQNIDKSLIGQHTSLLAAIGRSNSRSAENVYLIGAFLTFLVLFSAVIMIYNAFNISVTQRVRQFGMLRALGATPKQIRKLVRSEAVYVSLFGVLPGLLLGIIVSNILLLLLKMTMPEFFSSDGVGLFISWASLGIGALTGIMATVISSLMPARKAGKISPVEAMAAVNKKKIRKKTAWGLMTKILPIETAISQRRLMLRKRSFVLTALSLSFGILLILCFSPLVDMLRSGTEHNYDLGDIYFSDTTGAGFSNGLIDDIKKIDGIEKVYPKQIASVNATFDYSLLGDDYKSGVKNGNWLKVKAGTDGLVEAPSKSTLIGVSNDDLNKLNSKIIFGKADPNQLDRENGVVLILNFMGGVSVTDLRPGEYIYTDGKKLKICGIIKNDAIMFASNEKPFIGMYTTQKVFNSIADNKPSLVSMTLKKGTNSDIIYDKVKALIKENKNIQLVNQTEAQDTSSKIMLVGNVFIYGFTAVIALIGILNIINTMSTNILTRTREIGLLRASGMTMGQITAMVASEAGMYSLLALVIGLAIGLPLQHQFFLMMVKQIYAIPWSMPWNLVIVSSVITVAAAVISILSPLSQIKKIEITQAVTVE